MTYHTHEVFGISTNILEPSYVDRGSLDESIQKLLLRNIHIALRGESKCGKSWLRQKNLPDAIVVQCRLNKSVRDILVEAISNLGLSIQVEENKKSGVKFSVSAEGEIGIPLLSKLKTKLGFGITSETDLKRVPISNGIDDIRFFCEALNLSGRRLVIEDFHYLPPDQRRAFATDLKAMWDYQTYVVIIGIWNENNLLLHLNTDLAGRVEERSIYWQRTELEEVIEKGAKALNLQFSDKLKKFLIDDAFGTVGILQKLTLSLLDEVSIETAIAGTPKQIDQSAPYEAVAMAYAEQLNALYQTFAARVSGGIRKRKKATGIYGHMLKVVMEADDATLTSGISTAKIFEIASKQEPRIQKPNLRQILRKLDGLQVDAEGRGLILSYDSNKDEVTAVDKQLFLYRKYSTVKWPWEMIIEESQDDESYGDDED
jgi:hypothetical protein